MGKNKIKLSTFKLLKKAINIVFLIWMILIFIGSIRSTHLNITAVSPKLFTLIILFAICVVIYFVSNNIKSFIKNKVMSGLLNYKLTLLSIWSLLLIIGQIIFIAQTTTPIGFDVGGVVGQVLYGTSVPNYFSYNPNNLPLLFLEHFWGNHFGANWISFNFMSLLGADLGFMITILTARYINKNSMYTTWILSLLLLGCFPYIIVPYTDVLVLPFVSLSFLGYLIVKKINNLYAKLLGSLLIGIFGAVSFLLKPSSVIFIIAIIIVEITYLIISTEKIKVLYIVSILLVSFGSAFGVKQIYNSYLHDQQYIKVNPSMKKPPELFIAMGMVGNGGYNPPLTDEINSLKTQHEKKSVAIKNIKDTLHSYGIFGYLQFALKKNTNNTSNGAFGWLQEGNFILAPATNRLQQLVYPNGSHLLDYFFISQIVWVTLIVILTLGYKSPKKFEPIIMILKLSIIGSLMYLLLFEGGRSRYLIQFLPQIILLSGIYLNAYFTDHMVAKNDN
ncbi:glycosyltransferase family protein [Weissella paramesenteroides]